MPDATHNASYFPCEIASGLIDSRSSNVQTNNTTVVPILSCSLVAILLVTRAATLSDVFERGVNQYRVRRLAQIFSQ